MNFIKGDRVRHPTQDVWGVGEVLEVSRAGEALKIFFVGTGEKTILLKYVELIKVDGSDAESPVLDNLKINKKSSTIKYRSLPESIQVFLTEFPEGFHGEKYKKQEREYKDKASILSKQLLGKEDFYELLKAENYPEIVKRALKVSNATNLIFPNEKMSLKDGLQVNKSQEAFSIALYALLHENSDLEGRFTAFSNVLENIGASKWTTATYFLFIFHPDKYMFVKPTVTQYTSELCGYEVNYKPQLNWLTYESVLRFSEHVSSEISELEPQDMIDVQSFMWFIAT